MSAPTRSTRPGGRAATVVAAVHDAATALLIDGGYDALQLPDVAARAGVNKTTVYRRWPTKADLVSELLLGLTHHGLPDKDAGNLQADLVALIADVAALLATPLVRAMLRAAIAGQLDAELRAAFWEERFRRSAVIVERAIQRGELAPGVDAYRFLEQAVSPIYFRRLVTGEPISRADIRRFAQQAIAAVTTRNH